MLLVVFGAGASFDSASALRPDQTSATWRPPLANQLFELRRFGGYISQFPKCAPLITHLQSSEVNVERVLEKYQNEANGDPERLRQLAAVRFYLQTMLSELVVAWKGETSGVTNYKTLLDQIRHERKQDAKVCLATFNYDNLLEDALSVVNVRIGSMPDYVTGDYQIVKLHGSINWFHEVLNFHSVAGQHPTQTIAQLIETAPKLIFKGYQITPSVSLLQQSTNVALFPALSIPVENKPGYECPQSTFRS